MRTCCEILIKPFYSIKAIQASNLCINTKSKRDFLKTAAVQRPRGDVAAVMEVKHTKVIKVKERKRD